MRAWRIGIVQLLPALLLVIAAPALAQSSSIKAPETERVYLSGKGPDDAVAWQFTIDKGTRAGEQAAIKVPSNWQQQGFGHYQYGYDRGPRSDDHGVYRRSFDVPRGWEGKSIRLVFDGVMTDALVKVNGVAAGPVHQGGFSRFGFDVTKLLKFGASNEVEVAVSEASAAKDTDVAERWGDYWALSGIFRPVWLEVAPAEAIAHVAVDARANGDVVVEAVLGSARTASHVEGQVRTLDGDAVGAPFRIALPSGGAGRVRLAGKVDAPRLWSAETPNLYHVDVTVWNGQTPLHKVRTRVGFRTFEIREGDGLYLNGQRILLKGVNRHSFRPKTGRTLSRADAYADARMLRDLNMNAVRLSHYAAEEPFLEAADELGLYVIDELTGWQHAHDTEVGRKVVRELVERDVNHPSILIWANGNEGGWNRELDGDFALYDVQKRPVIHPWEVHGGIDTKHYPRYPDLVRRLAGPSLVLPTEFLHALYDGGAGSGLDDYWQAITGSPRGAGGFIWNLADEGIARHDQNGAIDTAATLAPDGIVGPNGEKEPNYFTVRDIWSPVQIANPVLGEGFDGRLQVSNGFDFTTLDDVRFDWRWLHFPGPNGGAKPQVVASGSVRGTGIAPHGSGVVQVAPRADADALEVVVRQGDRELLKRVWPTADASPVMLDRPRLGRPRVEEQGGTLRLTAGSATADFDPLTGLLAGLRSGSEAAVLDNGPRLVFARPVQEKVEPAFVAAVDAGAGMYRPSVPSMANVIDIESDLAAEDGWAGFTLQVSADGQEWRTVFEGARTARDGTRYPFAPQRVAAVRLIDRTAVRRMPVIRAVQLGYEADRFPVAPRGIVAVTSGTGFDPQNGRPVAWVEAKGAGGLDTARWTMDERGTLALDYAYQLSGPMLYHGVGFDTPAGVGTAEGLVRGPWPVWQNRPRGPSLGVHKIAARDDPALPTAELAGYFADPRWLRLDTGKGVLAVRNAGGASFLQLGARRADLPSTSVDFPHSDLGFMAAIPAMGAKFQPADTTGPAGQPSRAEGTYRGRLLFDLLPKPKGR